MNITHEYKVERAVARAMEIHGKPSVERLEPESAVRAKFSRSDICLDFTEVPSLLRWLQRYIARIDKVARNMALEEDGDANETLLHMHNVILATLIGVDTDCVYESNDFYGIEVVWRDGNRYAISDYDYVVFGATRAYHPLEKIGRPFTEMFLRFRYVMDDLELLAEEFFKSRKAILAITFPMTGHHVAPKFRFRKKDAPTMERLLAEMKLILLERYGYEGGGQKAATEFLKELAILICEEG